MSKNPPVTRAKISRRAVLHTTAWSLPVIVVAVAAPAAAESGGTAACLVYDGTDQLTFPVDTEAGSILQPRLTPGTTAAVAVWLEANSKGWPTEPSLFTATLTVGFNVMLHGEQVGSFTVTGSSAVYSPVHQDGFIEGWGAISGQVNQNASADFGEKLSHYPSDATPDFIPGTSKLNAVLEFAYSDSCTLTATGTLSLN